MLNLLNVLIRLVILFSTLEFTNSLLVDPQFTFFTGNVFPSQTYTSELFTQLDEFCRKKVPQCIAIDPNGYVTCVNQTAVVNCMVDLFTTDSYIATTVADLITGLDAMYKKFLTEAVKEVKHCEEHHQDRSKLLIKETKETLNLSITYNAALQLALTCCYTHSMASRPNDFDGYKDMVFRLSDFCILVLGYCGGSGVFDSEENLACADENGVNDCVITLWAWVISKQSFTEYSKMYNLVDKMWESNYAITVAAQNSAYKVFYTSYLNLVNDCRKIYLPTRLYKCFQKPNKSKKTKRDTEGNKQAREKVLFVPPDGSIHARQRRDVVFDLLAPSLNSLPSVGAMRDLQRQVQEGEVLKEEYKKKGKQLTLNISYVDTKIKILNCSVTWTELAANASLSLQIWMDGVNKLYTQYEEIRDNDSTPPQPNYPVIQFGAYATYAAEIKPVVFIVVACLLIFLRLKWLLNICL